MRFRKIILVHLFMMLGAIGAAHATTRIDIDLSTQTMHVEFLPAAILGPYRRRAPDTARLAAILPRRDFSACTTPKNTICRQCLTRFSFVAATLFMALTPQGRSGAQPRTAASAFRQPTPPSYSTWCNPKAAAFRSRARLPAPPASHGSIIGITRSSRACAGRTSIIPPMPLPMRPTTIATSTNP